MLKRASPYCTRCPRSRWTFTTPSATWAAISFISFMASLRQGDRHAWLDPADDAGAGRERPSRGAGLGADAHCRVGDRRAVPGCQGREDPGDDRRFGRGGWTDPEYVGVVP